MFPLCWLESIDTRFFFHFIIFMSNVLFPFSFLLQLPGAPLPVSSSDKTECELCIPCHHPSPQDQLLPCPLTHSWVIPRGLGAGHGKRKKMQLGRKKCS